jgi:hypothetical protein
MTIEELWYVGARILGVYLIVEGALSATGAVSAAGMGLPDGSNRVMFVLAPIFQAVVSIVAGALLVNVGRHTSRSSTVSVVHVHTLSAPLQLLGIYFLVGALVAAARPAVEIMFVSQPWQFRVGAFGAAGVGAVAGVLLIARAKQIAQKLNNFRSTVQPGPSVTSA